MPSGKSKHWEWRMATGRAALLTAIAVLTGGVAAADVDRALKTEGWHEQTFMGERPNRFERGEDGGIRVRSEGGSSTLYKEVAVDLAATPVLAWTWCQAEAGSRSGIEVGTGDERPLVVSVGFGTYPGSRVLNMLLGEEGPAPNEVLSYVRGGAGPVGGWRPDTALRERGDARVSVTAADGACSDERADLVADYRTAFGKAARRAVQLRVGAETGVTGAPSLGEVRDLRFLPRDR